MKYDPSFKERFDKTDVFVIEITSMKKYMYKDKYFKTNYLDSIVTISGRRTLLPGSLYTAKSFNAMLKLP